MTKKAKPLSAVIFLVILLTAVFFLEPKEPPVEEEVVPQIVDVSGKTQKVKIFLIALNDNGVKGKGIGCGDSAVAVERAIVPTKAVLKASLDELVALSEKNYTEGGLYNALGGSKLRVDTVSIDQKGKAKVDLSGNYKFTGVCEDARFIGQIEETVLQFGSVKEVEIFLNKRSLNNLYKN